MISVSFSHKSGLIFLSLSILHMELENSNESWQVGFKSAESNAAMFSASRRRRQAEQWFTLGLSVESFLQMHATRHSWIINTNLWLMCFGKLGRPLRCLFFLTETALWQVTRQGHNGWCETGGTTTQDCIWGAEPLRGEDPVIWQKGQQQHSTVTSPDPCFYTESVKKDRTAQPQEPWLVLLVYSMLKCKFKVQ